MCTTIVVELEALEAALRAAADDGAARREALQIMSILT